MFRRIGKQIEDHSGSRIDHPRSGNLTHTHTLLASNHPGEAQTKADTEAEGGGWRRRARAEGEGRGRRRRRRRKGKGKGKGKAEAEGEGGGRRGDGVMQIAAENRH
ncbi:hypothetical protein GCM10010171_19870 [Actinokineospora fastidiosa]|uniref:Uncharacterized protein n=1 Tax=Actinokineospora fastidiosa TaxID=1816 RepID=A0A918LAX6_9PSEU|nr:hypothetical protein GCM10010171_19870 [Actinokineospora fastidiosa]